MHFKNSVPMPERFSEFLPCIRIQDFRWREMLLILIKTSVKEFWVGGTHEGLDGVRTVVL